MKINCKFVAQKKLCW